VAQRRQIFGFSTAAVVVVSLALSGCGGSSPVSGGGSATTQAATPTTAPATTAATVPVTTTPATSPPTTAVSTTTAVPTTTAAPTTVAPTTTTVPKTTTTTAPKQAKGEGPIAPANLAAALKVKGPGPFHITPGTSPNNWPEVCDMLTVSELVHLDPSQITGLRGKPIGTKAEILGGAGNTKHDTECRYNVKSSIQGYPGDPSYVSISIQEVDSLAPPVYREDKADDAKDAKKYPGSFADYDLPGGLKCFFDASELECLKGDIYFYVSGFLDDANSSSQLPWIEHAELPIAVKLGSELTD
jgi:hypothetical protein